MRVPPIVVILAALLLVVAIAWSFVRSAPRYQIARMEDLLVVRLDTSTGEMQAFLLVGETRLREQPKPWMGRLVEVGTSKPNPFDEGTK